MFIFMRKFKIECQFVITNLMMRRIFKITQKLLRKIMFDPGIIKTLGINKVFEKMSHLITIFLFHKLYHNFIISLCH